MFYLIELIPILIYDFYYLWLHAFKVDIIYNTKGNIDLCHILLYYDITHFGVCTEKKMKETPIEKIYITAISSLLC